MCEFLLQLFGNDIRDVSVSEDLLIVLTNSTCRYYDLGWIIKNVSLELCVTTLMKITGCFVYFKIIEMFKSAICFIYFQCTTIDVDLTKPVRVSETNSYFHPGVYPNSIPVTVQMTGEFICYGNV